MSTPVAQLLVRIAADTGALVRGGKQAEGALNRIGSRAGEVTRRMASLRNAMAGLGGALVLRRAVLLIRDFETQMASVGAVTKATRSEMEAMQAQARKLGSTTVFSASQAAGGMEFLGRAGFKTAQIMAAMPGTLDLAAAGSLELSRAADIASNVLQAFNLQASEMGRVSDVLASAAANANTDVDMLATGLSYAAPVAHAFGVQVEETTAAIGTLSNAGIQAARAGTGLRKVLTDLAAPSAKLAKHMGGLTLQGDGFNAVMRKLSESSISASDAMEIFGDRGGPAFNVLRAGVKNTEDLSVALRNASGEAQRLAVERLGPMERAMRELNSAAEELMLVMGDAGLAGAVSDLATQMTDFARSGDALTMAEDLGSAFKFLADNVDILVTALPALLGARIGAAFGPWGIAAGALAGYLSGVAMRTDDVTAAAENLRRATSALNGAQNEAKTHARELAEARLKEAEATLAAAEASAMADQIAVSILNEGMQGGQSPANLKVQKLREEIAKARQELSSLLRGDVTDPGFVPEGASLNLPGADGNKGNKSGTGLGDTERETLTKRLEALREHLMTEAELETTRHMERLEQLKAALDAELVTRQEYASLKEGLDEAHQNKLTDIAAKAEKDRADLERKELFGRLSATANFFGDLASIAEAAGDKAFKQQKMLAIASALIGSIESATHAFNWGTKIGGPVLGAAFAAAATAAQVARVAQIKSVQPGSGAASGGGSFAAPATPAQAVNSQQTLLVQGIDAGSLWRGDNVRDLAERLIEFQENGGRVVIQ